jgi:hypothetical protein
MWKGAGNILDWLQTSGANAQHFAGFSARLKPCPPGGI